MNENFIEMKIKFDNLMTVYNKNIEDYNNIVNDCNYSKKLIIELRYLNQYNG